MKVKQQSVGLREDSLTVGKVVKLLNELAPQSYSVLGDEEGLLLGDEDQKITKVGVVWYLSPHILGLMVNEGVDMIITHTYPFLRRSVAKLEGYSGLSSEALFPNQLKKKLLRQKGVALYRIHSAWDNADEGNNDALAKALGLERVKKVPFGRVGYTNDMTLGKFSELVKNKLGSKHLRFVGEPRAKVGSVMVVAGTGFLFPELVEYCYTEGIDVLVSGDLIKKTSMRAAELGVSLIDAGSRETEVPGMLALANKLKEQGLSVDYYEVGDGYEYV